MGKKRRKARYNRKEFFKRVAKGGRDWHSPEYKRWRKDVKTRDSFQCQMPGCLSKKRIQVHHIKTWAKYPGLRFVVANGITLCRHCHDSIKGKEHDYEEFFIKLLEWQVIEKVKKYNQERSEQK